MIVITITDNEFSDVCVRTIMCDDFSLLSLSLSPYIFPPSPSLSSMFLLHIINLLIQYLSFHSHRSRCL